MDKNELLKKVEEGLSTWKMATFFNTTQPNIRYWLNKYDIKTKRMLAIESDTKDCPKCNETKDRSEFYKYKKSSSYCKKCICKGNLERRRDTKELAVIYKGGKCQNCGYNKCMAALEFHHINPLEKDKDYFNHKSGFTENLKSQLDLCILLCANCHREHHSNNSENIDTSINKNIN